MSVTIEINPEDMSLDYLASLLKEEEDLASYYYGAGYQPNNKSLDDFLSLLRELMEVEQAEKAYKVILVDDFSKNNIFEDPRDPKNKVLAVVTCSVTGSKPGSWNQTNQPMTNSGVREIRPSLRGIEKIQVDDKSSYKYYFGQLFDNQISFKIHARSNKEANEVTAWFQNLLMMHKKFFAQKGIIRYYFLEREADSVVKESDGVIYVRPLSYYLTTEETYVTSEHVIQEIKLKLKTT